jgi:transposase
LAGNYERNLFKQFEEALIKIDFLMKENQTLKAEITMLKGSHQKETMALHAKIESLDAENRKLKDIVNKDSSNSSKPPSSDGFKNIHNSREKTGKTVGGQKGHKGHTLELYDKPTEIVEHKKELCDCGGHIIYSDEYKVKQLVDFEIKIYIVEHRAYLKGVCADCDAKFSNEFPKELNNTVTYGNNLKSFSALLSAEGIVSICRIKQIISELTDGVLDLSEGTIVNFNKKLSSKVKPVIEHIKEKLLTSLVNHKDETGIKTNGVTNWFHVLSNKEQTLYTAHKKRGIEADKEADVLPSYSGVLVHDHAKWLYKFKCEHSECNAHILRYLKSVIENEKRVWAKDMTEILVGANNTIKKLKANSIFCFSDICVQEYYDKYDVIINNGENEFKADLKIKNNYNGEDMKLLRRMKEFKMEHLRFISNFNVPFDNNLAERDLRMIKAKSKISGSFRSVNGGEIFANIKSYTSTLRKNKKNLFQGITLVFNNNPVFV